jgi:hypothetical protein
VKIALLSAGPSLKQTFDPDAKFDLRIGVNRAVGTYHCDWWACGDGQTFREHVPIGYPVVFTMSHTDGQLRAKDTLERLDKHRVLTWGDFARQDDGAGLPPCWTNWSITAGLTLAVCLKAREVHVYGHDMAGVTDVSGRRLDKRAENWKRVGRDWLTMVGWAKDRGVLVREHKEAVQCV